MICRLWHGWTTADDAGESCLREELYPRLEHELSDRGYRGHQVFRRARGNEVEFVTMTWFESVKSVRGFARDDYETPVTTCTAAKLLAHCDPRAGQFDSGRE